MENLNDKKTPPPKQTIIFLQNNSIFDQSQNKNYTVQGNHHNIINQSKKLNDIYQNNHSTTELEIIKKENEFLKNEIEFLKKQLEITQSLLDKALGR